MHGKSPDPGAGSLGSTPSFSTNLLCDAGQAASPLGPNVLHTRAVCGSVCELAMTLKGKMGAKAAMRLPTTA